MLYILKSLVKEKQLEIENFNQLVFFSIPNLVSKNEQIFYFIYYHYEYSSECRSALEEQF